MAVDDHKKLAYALQALENLEIWLAVRQLVP
jgi:hypothetical protein